MAEVAPTVAEAVAGMVAVATVAAWMAVAMVGVDMAGEDRVEEVA